MQIVTSFGTMWARKSENIDKVPGSKKGGKGVYIQGCVYSVRWLDACVCWKGKHRAEVARSEA